jgi:hypothetical protein
LLLRIYFNRNGGVLLLSTKHWLQEVLPLATTTGSTPRSPELETDDDDASGFKTQQQACCWRSNAAQVLKGQCSCIFHRCGSCWRGCINPEVLFTLLPAQCVVGCTLQHSLTHALMVQPFHVAN